MLRFLKRFWPRRTEQPATAATLQTAELQRARLKRTFYYCREVLAYEQTQGEPQFIFIPKPCERCMATAIQHAMWEVELERELSALSPHSATDAEDDVQAVCTLGQ